MANFVVGVILYAFVCFSFHCQYIVTFVEQRCPTLLAANSHFLTQSKFLALKLKLFYNSRQA